MNNIFFVKSMYRMLSMEERSEVKEMREKVYDRIEDWIWVDKNNSWDRGDMLELDVICELDDEGLVSVLKEMREEIEVLKRVLKNVEEIEEMYYEEYLKRGKKEE